MANPWFRMYAEFATDPKVQMMSESDQRRFVMLLCLRCSNDDVTLHDDEVAFQLRISNDEWSRSKALFLQKGLINEDNTPTSWDKRQFVSDSSAERVRRHRENKKKAAKRACNVTETPPEADTEADTDTSLSPAPETADVAQQTIAQPEELAATHKGTICRRLRHEARVASAAPHQLTDETWDQILAKRTDEEIIEFAKAKAAEKPGVGLRYLAPGLLEDPKPIATPENGGSNGSRRSTLNDQRAAVIAELTGSRRREHERPDSHTLAGQARVVG